MNDRDEKGKFIKGLTPWNKGIIILDEKRHKHTNETKLKIAKAITGIIRSDVTRKRISESLKGKKSPKKGIKAPREQRMRLSAMSNNRKGTHQTAEHIRKRAEANKGKHHITEENRKKLLDANIGRPTWNKGIPHTATTRKNISDALKGKPSWNSGKSCIQFQGENNGRWKGGISYLPYCHKFNKELKEKIRNRDNRTCQLCGETENGRKLSIHHIHYDKENCEPDLIALCVKCNAKVNLNRDYYEALFIQKLKDRGII